MLTLTRVIYIHPQLCHLVSILSSMEKPLLHLQASLYLVVVVLCVFFVFVFIQI